MSKDGGRTWTSWLSGQLGAVGEYLIKAVWRALGMISQPGILAEFWVAEAVNFTSEAATWNVARY